MFIEYDSNYRVVLFFIYLKEVIIISQVDLELGNIIFNNNTNQCYTCPDYVVALLRDIQRQLSIIMWNINQKEYDNPFENTGASYKNDTFKVQAYNWDDEINQPYNFYYKNNNNQEIKISWYKYLGRDTTVNALFSNDVFIQMYQDCIKSLQTIENKELSENNIQ